MDLSNEREQWTWTMTMNNDHEQWTIAGVLPCSRRCRHLRSRRITCRPRSRCGTSQVCCTWTSVTQGQQPVSTPSHSMCLEENIQVLDGLTCWPYTDRCHAATHLLLPHARFHPERTQFSGVCCTLVIVLCFSNSVNWHYARFEQECNIAACSLPWEDTVSQGRQCERWV